MISLHVIAEDLSPKHLLAAVLHWASKFEQEIMNLDGGPKPTGVYEFEHDGKPTEVHWNRAYNKIGQTEYLRANLQTPLPGADPVTGLYANEEPLADGPEMSDEAKAAIDEAIKSKLPTEPAPPPEAAAAFALAASMDPEPASAPADIAPAATDPEAAAPKPAEPTAEEVAAKAAADQPKESHVEGETATDAALRVAPDLE